MIWCSGPFKGKVNDLTIARQNQEGFIHHLEEGS
jgi:hypothetical protein